MPPDSSSVSLSIFDEASEGAPFLTLPGGIGLYRKRVVLQLAVTEETALTAEVRFEGCFFQLGTSDLFVSQFLPGTQKTQPFDLIFHWDRNGVSFAGGTMLEITLPIQAELPGINIEALHIIVQPDMGNDASVNIELSLDIAGNLLDVISAEVQRIGITSHFYLSGDHPGAIFLGPIAATADFQPPSGVGLSVNLAGVVKGGGFVKVLDNHQGYAGILSLSLFGIGITATAIITTSPSFALLVILTAEFRPVGIDVGFGFTLNAVGGLFGLNHGADQQALAAGVRDNSVSSILFPANPIENAPQILRDLDRIFPLLPDHFLIGPMLQLGWGKPTGMFTLSLGVIIQVPDPKIAIVGVLKVLVPALEDQALLRLQVNFTGGVDVSRQFLWFDASLYDSRLIMYVLEGDMCARLLWGDNANFAVSVGGFNPRYVPAADLQILPMKRVTINLLPTSDNPRLRISSYYAATSNTLQHGASLDAYAEALGFSIRGFLGYDLLAQVSPLHFEIDFGGGVSVYEGDDEIMGITLGLHLSGPSPWHVDGDASFKVIFRIHIPVHAQFGSDDAPQLPEADLVAVFNKELSTTRNWSSILPDQTQLLVALVPNISVGDQEVLVHPSATIQFNQSEIPLGVKIQKFFGAKPKDVDTFNLIGIAADGGPGLQTDLTKLYLDSEFAPGQYFDRSNDDLISAPAFQQIRSGIRADPASLVGFGLPAPRDLNYCDNLIDSASQESPFTGKFVRRIAASPRILGGLAGSAVGRSGLFADRMASRPSIDEIKLQPNQYRIVDANTMLPAAQETLTSHIAATQAMAAMVAANPQLQGTLTVAREFELV